MHLQLLELLQNLSFVEKFLREAKKKVSWLNFLVEHQRKLMVVASSCMGHYRRYLQISWGRGLICISMDKALFAYSWGAWPNLHIKWILIRGLHTVEY